ncbi:MAG: hypothetical protein ACMUEM_05755 [Flavobacteriales bacterium AspAUS03]
MNSAPDLDISNNQFPNRLFIEASREGMLDEIESLLNVDINPIVRGGQGISLLHIVAKEGYEK